MPDWGRVLQGGGSGAAAGSAFGPWGTAIGGVLGAAGGLFGGDQPDYNAQRMQIYNQMMAGHMEDPRVTQSLKDLQAGAETKGLTDSERMGLTQSEVNVNDQLRGQTGAIEDRQLARGGGAGSSGLMAALSQGAAQQSNNAMAAQGTGALQQASARQQAALKAFNEGAARAQAASDSYRLAAGGMATTGGAYGTQNAQTNYGNTADNIASATDSAAALAKKYAGSGGGGDASSGFGSKTALNPGGPGGTALTGPGSTDFGGSSNWSLTGNGQKKQTDANSAYG